MNPLEQYPTARRYVYTALWSVGGALAAVVAWCATLSIPFPTWLTGALGVYPVIGAYVGYTAMVNTPKSADPVSSERLRAIDGTTLPGVPTDPLEDGHGDEDYPRE